VLQVPFICESDHQLDHVVDALVAFMNRQLLVTALDELDGETPLLELGLLDSLSMISLLTFVETQFGVRVPDDAVIPEHFENLQAMARLVARLQADTLGQPEGAADGNALVDTIRVLEAVGVRRQSATLETGDAMHALRVPGAQPTWVLLPGLGNPSSSWGKLLQSLKDENEAIAIDLAGFGLSVSRRERPNYSDHCNAIVPLLEAIAQPPFVLVGSSAGAMIATEIARRRPEWVQALVVTGFGLISDVDAWWQRLMDLSTSPEAFLAAAYYRPPQLTASLHALIDDVLSRPAYHSFLERGGFAAMRTTFDDLRVPTLFVAGQNDAIIPPEAVIAAAQRVPGSRLEWLARCGHFPPAEQPEELIYVIRNFLQRLALGREIGKLA
jgi:2-hydroxymuconate-semialdehyde hydrolase